MLAGCNTRRPFLPVVIKSCRTHTHTRCPSTVRLRTNKETSDVQLGWPTGVDPRQYVTMLDPLQLFMTREPNPGFRSPSASSSGVFSYDLAEGVQSGHHLCESTLGGQAPERSCPTSTSGLCEHRVQGTRPEYKAILKDES